jgi:hypothetical protein
MRFSNAIVAFTQAALIAVIIFLFYIPLLYAECTPLSDSSKKSYTIMLYLNGDNSLTHEVLYALDMLETVGSSDEINILALVDGRPGADHGYGNGWDGSKLIYVTHDARIGEINSLILQDMDEQNLGSPETLESFIQKCLKFRAERYIFCTFAHGRGIIDTKTLTTPGAHKSLAISMDETDKTQLTLQEFRSAIQRGLDGQKFDAMVFFSCLTGMAEVAYALKDLTGYLIASEDEIRIVNDPPGSFQIRGIKFEEPLKAIRNNPYLSIADFGRVTIDKFIEQYTRDVNLKDVNGQPYHCRYPATLAIVDCRTFDQLASYLNNFADYIIERLQASHNAEPLLKEIRFTLSETQRYRSFLNLEYFDVQDLLLKLAAETGDEHLKKLCHEVVDFVNTKVIVYERHTLDSASNGLSIYFPHPLIPENIFQCHQAMYRKSEFSKDTSWDEMIEIVRRQMAFDGKRF